MVRGSAAHLAVHVCRFPCPVSTPLLAVHCSLCRVQSAGAAVSEAGQAGGAVAGGAGGSKDWHPVSCAGLEASR